MRLIARYAQEQESTFDVITVFDKTIRRETIPKASPSLRTLSGEHPAAAWFERKMYDDFGIRITDAADRRPLVHHEHFPSGVHPLRQAFRATHLSQERYRPYPYETVQGDGVFQVGVGPIHAGIIEPGHFHFSQAGEAMLHLEVRHFYKHRGIEKMLEGKSPHTIRPIIERISGNETIAYQIAWRDLLLQASGQTLPEGLQKRHAFLLELERIIHHLTDVGFIPNDAGFGAALAWGSGLAEQARRMMRDLTGHRFGFGAISCTTDPFDSASMRRWIASLREEFGRFREWISGIPSLWDRLDTTGTLSAAQARRYDTVGVMARASGIALDRRNTPFYAAHGFEMALQSRGDVGARFTLRLQEIDTSLIMMEHLMDDDTTTIELDTLQDGEYMSYCESSLGELFMSVTIQSGRIKRFFVRDPSFINWQTLPLLMERDIIADFPLINKSCDLSYAGNDL